ncbi:transcriptional regulator with XRE-family HTH domain [Pullulanibacillus pueri]|uniref:Transcriptional regulator n=1 Tax=Pullulanibacillus pueri TaxID=1437324 RepID=A0A8J2ZZR9_9BACL|nr:helix-turn-helix transcriptional regulator [Pullulanibacillus pueri]MBM7683377.1 transcriptional regulator with XRE-family HTH domain [Pullulanibacillus pueri]GGH86551.1 transcriptional regulator [Pullulanibacillus pueri]
MGFGEKLYKLRKGKGFSQEALAEKLGTTRQAISKWENGQGFPETEKLLMIGNIFEVSMDYLLKDVVEQHPDDEDGYYVSKEMAEGFLLNQLKLAKSVAWGLSLIALAFVPYFIFENPAVYSFLIIIIAALGFVMFLSSGFIEDSQYRVLKQEPLMFDEKYLKALEARYEGIKKRYIPIIMAGLCPLFVGIIAYGLERKGVAQGVLVPYYPIFIFFISIGVYVLARTTTIIEAYKLLVKNEEHVNRLSFRLKKKVRNKVSHF